jgi:serine/threonine protein kinase
MAVAKDMKKSHGYIMGGTPLYLAPEAFEKDGKIYPKSDLWSCGVIIYQLIHQSLPFNSLKEIVSTNFQHTCAQSNVCNKFSPLLKKYLMITKIIW